MRKPAEGGLLFVSAIIVLFVKEVTKYSWASGLILALASIST